MSNFLSPDEMDEVLKQYQTISTTSPVDEVSISSSPTQVVEKPVDNASVSFPLRGKGLSGNAPLPLASPDFDGIDIANPVELLLLLDDKILSGEIKLHDWQVQFMMDFACPDHTKDSPFRAAVQACNGSGKDKYIIAACAVWLSMRYTGVETPITSSSGNQLDNQTSAHIERLCHRANSIFGPLWKINYRYYECQHKTLNGEPIPSVLKLFATDEAGKVEGYHPTDAGKKMAIFTSETKSIPDDITAALVRCVGYTHRVDASSPGLASGYYHNICTTAIPRAEVDDIKALDSTQTILYKVTAYDCNHITESEIESFAASLPGGKSSPVFRSGMLAEFCTTDEMVVIPSGFVWRAVENHSGRKKPFDIQWVPEDHNNAGLDLSDGGAETVLAVRNGNKLIALECFRFEDTEETIEYLEELFKKYSLNNSKSSIHGDYCGLGGPMLRSLKKRGWKNVKFIDSRNTAAEPKTYANRGTELFFNLRKLLENKDLILFYDKLLIEQLCTRYYKLSLKSVYALLSKLEQKAKGYASPDRADGLNLCFWNYKSTKTPDEIVPPYEEPKDQEKEKEVYPFDMRVWAHEHENNYNPERVDNSDGSDISEAISEYNRQLIRK